MPMTRFLDRSAGLAWALLVASAICFALMVMDDEPPFAMLSQQHATVRPGDVLRVEAAVTRDLTRRCSVTFSRHMFDRDGTRVDLVPDTYMPAAAIDDLQRRTPGQLRLAVPIPSYVPPGPAKLVVPLSYVCNAWQALRPIETKMVIDFEVLP